MGPSKEAPEGCQASLGRCVKAVIRTDTSWSPLQDWDIFTVHVACDLRIIPHEHEL